MTADVYILGTSHSVQCGSAPCTQADIAAFETELRSLLDTFKIQRIAEEITADGLEHHAVAETVAQRVADEVGIPHQSVDLPREERARLSLDDSVVVATVRRCGISHAGAFREAFDDLADGVRERNAPVLHRFLCASSGRAAQHRVGPS